MDWIEETDIYIIKRMKDSHQCRSDIRGGIDKPDKPIVPILIRVALRLTMANAKLLWKR